MISIDPGLLSLITLIINVIVLPLIGIWIRRLEKNTNSIKDALVTATRKVGNAEGRVELAEEMAANDTATVKKSKK